MLIIPGVEATKPAWLPSVPMDIDAFRLLVFLQLVTG
jgi:hypothetical protein